MLFLYADFTGVLKYDRKGWRNSVSFDEKNCDFYSWGIRNIYTVQPLNTDGKWA